MRLDVQPRLLFELLYLMNIVGAAAEILQELGGCWLVLEAAGIVVSAWVH